MYVVCVYSCPGSKREPAPWRRYLLFQVSSAQRHLLLQLLLLALVLRLGLHLDLALVGVEQLHLLLQLLPQGLALGFLGLVQPQLTRRPWDATKTQIEGGGSGERMGGGTDSIRNLVVKKQKIQQIITTSNK